jgi:hypothetical protein
MSADRENREHKGLMTEAQVIAALRTAGIDPVADPAMLAQILSAQLEATDRAFARIDFDIEPASCHIALRRERS